MAQQLVTLGLQPSFGFGDRIGLATPGHAAALRRAGGPIRPIFAQQSIREMGRTGRTPEQVMADALTGTRAAGYDGPMGTDADHLKSPEDIARTAAAGFVFFTLDPSDHVDPRAEEYSLLELRARYAELSDESDWLERYHGREERLETGTAIRFTEEVCLRAAVKYGRAIHHAVSLAQEIERVMSGRDYEVELSVDETTRPTTPAEHWMIAEQCRESGLRLVSLAPRFAGDFEKGVDYKGSLELFERCLADHAAIARRLGPYKLSLHSGSDKLSIYSTFARVTRGRFHVKTAGTSYLEALRVAARHDPALFRRIVTFARERYPDDRASYHVSATIAGVPSPLDVSDDRELERLYLELWPEVPPGRGFTAPGRQILHCTFGSVLTHPELGPALKEALTSHPDAYEELLAEHFARHLEPLQTGIPSK